MLRSALVDIPSGSHVGWVFADHDRFKTIAKELIDRGSEQGERTAVFGPHGGDTLRELSPYADLSADPWFDFLGGNRFEPDVMYAMFQKQVAEARSLGYQGLRVVADMDWLLPATPTDDAVVAFELLLDRVISELGATVVCAYRQSSFARDAIHGTLAVHPVACGQEPFFRFVAGGERTWVLSGEVDLSVASPFAVALAKASGSGDCVIDVTDLAYIDVAATRLLVQASADNPLLRFRNPPACLSRVWELGSFDQIAELNEAG